MVEVIYTKAEDHVGFGGGRPLIHIHKIERHVHGNSIDVKVYAEIKIAAGERVWAKELKLKTIEVMVLTPESGRNIGRGYIANKWIYRKGEYGNYASINIFDDTGTFQGRGVGPYDGSHWLDAIIEGE